MIKGKRMTTKTQENQEKQITLSGRVVEEDDGEPLDDESEETEVDEEKERAWREDLALIVKELDEEERREEMREQVRAELEELKSQDKVQKDEKKDEEDWEDLFNKHKKD